MSHNDSTENKRRQLLEAFGRQRGAGSRDAITRQARPADLPASAEQVRMWVQMAISGGAGHFHVPHVLEIAGTLDEAALQARARRGRAARGAAHDVRRARRRLVPACARARSVAARASSRGGRDRRGHRPHDHRRNRAAVRLAHGCCACRCIVSATRGRFRADRPSPDRRRVVAGTDAGRLVAGLRGAAGGPRAEPPADDEPHYADYALWQQARGAADSAPSLALAGPAGRRDDARIAVRAAAPPRAHDGELVFFTIPAAARRARAGRAARCSP